MLFVGHATAARDGLVSFHEPQRHHEHADPQGDGRYEGWGEQEGEDRCQQRPVHRRKLYQLPAEVLQIPQKVRPTGGSQYRHRLHVIHGHTLDTQL